MLDRTPVAADAPKRAKLPYQSLAERLAEHRKQTDRSPDPTFVGRLYDHLYQLHFDRPSRRRSDDLRTNAILGRVFSWCVMHDVDVATYIAANMTLLKDRLGRHSFQPNMLSGEKAANRYNGYLSRANKRYRRGTHEVFVGSETGIGRLREQLALSEESVAEYYVRVNLRGVTVTWEDAIDCADVTSEWVDFTNHRGCWRSLAEVYGQDRPAQEFRLMQLRAAWSVAQGLQNGLPNRIGFTEFSWRAFLDLMQQVLPERKPAPAGVDLTDIGDTWGNWGGKD